MRAENMVCIKENYDRWFNSPFMHPNRDAIISKLLDIERSSFKLWSIMDFDTTRLYFASGQRQLTNGQAMTVLAILCRESLTR